MDLGLKDKVVVLTGAAIFKTSLGEVILKQLVEEGSIPIIIQSSEKGFSQIKELQKKEIDVLFYKTEMTNPASIERTL